MNDPSTVVVATSPIVTPISSAPDFDLQSRDHRLRHVDAVYRHAAPRERKRDAPRPDRELERAATSGELGQEVDDRIDRLRVEHLGVVVVGRGDALVEVPVIVHARNLLRGRRT